jgi:glycosyltransferase involved in cell wall biosynthesis
LKLAILGTRGVPPRYGGFETFAGELSRRLVMRGHEVAVYCRDGEGEWDGVERIVLPAIRHKYFETVSHTFLSALDALRRGFDAVLLCNAANAFVLPLLRAARIPVAINVDGIERRRRKWNALGRAVYASGETLAAMFADRVVADAEVIAEYYREVHAIEPAMIPYGAEFPDEPDSDILQKLQVEPGKFFLYVSRFEPENNPLEVVRAYERFVVRRSSFLEAATNHELRTANPPLLVMVGSAAYAKDLETALKRHASPRILFPGAIYGRDYRTLQRNALLYIQATEVGGTHPALIEAMASGGCVVALDTPENREVGGDAIRYFRLGPNETLSGMLCESAVALRAAARARAKSLYSWDRVTDDYERLLFQIAH